MGGSHDVCVTVRDLKTVDHMKDVLDSSYGRQPRCLCDSSGSKDFGPHERCFGQQLRKAAMMSV